MANGLRRFATTTAASLWLFSAPAVAQEPPVAQAAPAEDPRVVSEHVRAQVDLVFRDLAQPRDRGEHASPLFNDITERLLAIGPELGPVMIAELDQKSRATFNIAAYLIGYQAPPGGKEALVRAAQLADHDGGEFGKDRKAWAAYAIAMLADPSVVDLLDTGKANIVKKEFAEDMTMLEVVTVLTAPASRPLLLEKLDRYGKDPELQDRLYVVLRALGRVADSSIIDRVTPYLKHSEPYVRDAAARALAATGESKVADRLFAALDDPALFSRFGVAAALESLKPPGKARVILSKLATEEDTATRGALYRLLAATAPEGQVVQAFAGFWGRPEALDRVAIVDALGAMRGRKGLNLLRNGLKDPDPRVTLHAIDALSVIGGPGVTDTLLALLKDPRWPVERTAIEVLVTKQEHRAAPRIADRLRAQIAVPLSDASQRDVLTARGDGLIGLRDTALLPELETAIDVQTDPEAQDDLRSLVKRMRVLKEFGEDRARWVAAVSSDDPEIRALAYTRLVELPGKEAAQALSDEFGRVPVEEGFEILRAVGRIGSADSAPLVERVLLDPSFDAYERLPLRRMAAWAALRIGGDSMAAALRNSAQRRDGQDVDVLTYLALLIKQEALPILESHRPRQLRYFDWHMGLELTRLDWLTRELKAGRTVDALNRPPDEIALYPIMP